MVTTKNLKEKDPILDALKKADDKVDLQSPARPI